MDFPHGANIVAVAPGFPSVFQRRRRNELLFRVRTAVMCSFWYSLTSYLWAQLTLKMKESVVTIMSPDWAPPLTLEALPWLTTNSFVLVFWGLTGYQLKLTKWLVWCVLCYCG